MPSHSGGKAEISKPMDDREVVIQGKHEDHATHILQRVTHDAHSTAQLLLIINHHGTAEESVIRDASERIRSLLQEQLERIDTLQKYSE